MANPLQGGGGDSRGESVASEQTPTKVELDPEAGSQPEDLARPIATGQADDLTAEAGPAGRPGGVEAQPRVAGPGEEAADRVAPPRRAFVEEAVAEPPAATAGPETGEAATTRDPEIAEATPSAASVSDTPPDQAAPQVAPAQTPGPAARPSRPAPVKAKAARPARPASPLGEDDALITDDEAPTPRGKSAGTMVARPERKGAGEGPPPDERHDPATPLEFALADALAAYDVEFRSPAAGEPVLIVPADHLLAVARILKEDARFACDYPRCISGVDLIDRLELVYHLFSIRHGHQIWIRVRVPAGAPRVPSVTPIWKGADWHEREAAELFGFEFAGHPGLKLPFLLDDGFEGHPLLKSFELEPEISNVFPSAGR
ncbi:MAG TPA: NADH-quinone oxidoreductase subunit C [Dehalococcoidia bacterium]|nr:NADH-quinone oxidoreductase subunit C [Dehalococcoidia bacterium]